MIPKSTATLREGDFCLIRRQDGKYVPFVFLIPKGRSYFYGSLATSVLDSEDAALPEKVGLSPHALVHIKCFKENNTPIVGNLREHLDAAQLENIRNDLKRSGSVGHTTRVWGHRTIVAHAKHWCLTRCPAPHASQHSRLLD